MSNRRIPIFLRFSFILHSSYGIVLRHFPPTGRISGWAREKNWLLGEPVKIVVPDGIGLWQYIGRILPLVFN